MGVTLLTFSQIVQFMTIVKYMSITEASKELFITQPALSYSLSKMETELGVKLFDRKNNKLFLTDEGKIMFPEIERVYNSYRRMLKSAKRLNDDYNEKIVVGYTGPIYIFTSMFLNGIMSTYKVPDDSGKEIAVEKVFADKEQIENMLKNHQIDIAITIPPISDTAVSTKIIFRDPIALCCSPTHPFAKYDSGVPAEELAQHKIHSLTKSNPFRQYCDNLFKKRDIKLNQYDLECDDLSDCIKKGADGEPVAFFTMEKLVETHYSKYGYVGRKINGVDTSLVTGISWPGGSDVPYKYPEFIKKIEDDYQKYVYEGRRVLF